MLDRPALHIATPGYELGIHPQCLRRNDDADIVY